MADLKSIRKRIGTVKSTQKITKAMKLVAGARLNRAQHRIVAMRPYADAIRDVWQNEAETALRAAGHVGISMPAYTEEVHPLLARREEKGILLVVLTSDRGLCGSFNTSICKAAQARWESAQSEGKRVELAIVGRKGHDYFQRRNAPIREFWDGVWGDLRLENIRPGVKRLLRPFLDGEYDGIYLMYNEFKNAAEQEVTEQCLLPIELDYGERTSRYSAQWKSPPLYIVEPDMQTVAETLVPMYIEISILKALYESMASELGARMTAMDTATKNAEEMIDRLTLQYNRLRQAAITTELMELIGGAEALKS